MDKIHWAIIVDGRIYVILTFSFSWCLSYLWISSLIYQKMPIEYIEIWGEREYCFSYLFVGRESRRNSWSLRRYLTCLSKFLAFYCWYFSGIWFIHLSTTFDLEIKKEKEFSSRADSIWEEKYMDTSLCLKGTTRKVSFNEGINSH